MTLGGWIIMIVSVGGTTLFFIWTIVRVLTIPGETEKVHGFELQTRDKKQDKA